MWQVPYPVTYTALWLEHAIWGDSTQQASARALQILSLKLQQQAALLAYDKIYLTMGVLFTCALPLLLLFRTGRVAGGRVDAH